MESREQVGLAHARVPNENNLEEQIVAAGGGRGSRVETRRETGRTATRCALPRGESRPERAAGGGGVGQGRDRVRYRDRV